MRYIQHHPRIVCDPYSVNIRERSQIKPGKPVPLDGKIPQPAASAQIQVGKAALIGIDANDGGVIAQDQVGQIGTVLHVDVLEGGTAADIQCGNPCAQNA